MIKALLLIFFPMPMWERIVVARRKWPFIFLSHLMPLLLIASAAEGYGLVHWKRAHGQLSDELTTFTVKQALVFEFIQLAMGVAIVFLMAKLVKSFGETFHGRHSFTQAFTLAAYGMSPIFLMRVFDAFPRISPWVTWGVGVALSLAIIYHGLPKVMQPDPPHAFGLYLVSALLLILVTGLGRFLTVWYLEGRFVRLDALISRLLGN